MTAKTLHSVAVNSLLFLAHSILLFYSNELLFKCDRIVHSAIVPNLLAFIQMTQAIKLISEWSSCLVEITIYSIRYESMAAET